jgi:hypothetical protein
MKRGVLIGLFLLTLCGGFLGTRDWFMGLSSDRQLSGLERVEEVPFESRVLEEGDQMWEMRGWGKDVGVIDGVTLEGLEFVLQSLGGVLRLEAEVMNNGARGDW